MFKLILIYGNVKVYSESSELHSNGILIASQHMSPQKIVICFIAMLSLTSKAAGVQDETNVWGKTLIL